jgi:hypothetical protein
LQELQVRRKFCIKAATKLRNSVGALARRALGWSLELSEAERKKIEARASTITATAIAGKEQSAANREVFEVIAPELVVVRLALEPLETRRNEIELQMKKLTRKLPAYDFMQGVAGFGELGLAVLVGESGDLSNYSGVRKLWKRLGLAPYEGKACSTWRMKGGLTADEWTTLGYKPTRLAEIYSCVTEPMAKHQIESAKKSETEFGKPAGKYGEIYVKRREQLAGVEGMTRGHAQKDALRIMTKALVFDLWRAWNGSDASLDAAMERVARSTTLAADAA